MSDGAVVHLVGERSRQAACALVMRAPTGWLCQIDKPRRTLLQSSRFWAACGDVARSGITWSGTTHSKDDWHDLFLCGWNVVKEHPARLTIGLEGELVALMRHTRSLSESEMSELLDYQSAWCAMKGITLREEQ